MMTKLLLSLGLALSVGLGRPGMLPLKNSDSVKASMPSVAVNLCQDLPCMKTVVASIDDHKLFMKDLLPVFLQYGGDSQVKLIDIASHSIDEMIALSFVDHYDLHVSDEDLECAIEQYQGVGSHADKDALSIYGLANHKEALRNRLLVSTFKSYAMDHLISVDSSLIASFKAQDQLPGALSQYSDGEILDHFRKEVEDFAYHQWISEQRKKHNIQYDDGFDKYKGDSLIYNRSDENLSVEKIDAKDKALTQNQVDDLLERLPEFARFTCTGGSDVFGKSSDGQAYDKKIFTQLNFVDQTNKDVDFVIQMSDVGPIPTCYGLSDPRSSTLCGVQVTLSQTTVDQEEPFTFTQAVFTVQGRHYRIEAHDISVFDFNQMVFSILDKLTS